LCVVSSLLGTAISYALGQWAGMTVYLEDGRVEIDNNLVENAIDFAKARIRIDLHWDAMVVRITIEDDGPGFRPEVLARLGDPYISTKGPDRRAKSDEGGLGLGLFIAKTLLERSGASVAVANATPPLTGARIVVSWPRASFETVTADVSTVTNQGDEALAIQAYIHGKPRVNP
jgi:two-component system sensor histidine kinase RegB